METLDLISASRSERGAYFERVADHYLRHLGYKLWRRNFRVRGGECDWIGVHKMHTLVFVEVRSSFATRPWLSLEEGFSSVKVKRWKFAASMFLSRYEQALKMSQINGVRFDLILFKKNARAKTWPVFSLEHLTGVAEA